MTEEQKEMQEEMVSEVPQGSQPAPDSTELTVTDLAQLRQIIDVATGRGAFKASEMTQVGPVYDKLDKFLNHIAAQQQAQQETQAKSE